MEFLKEYMDYAIFGILGFMSFLVVWFTIERIIFYANFNVHKYSSVQEVQDTLTKNLTALYIVYSNAPYIGLLGTVIGIMVTFYEMGQSSIMDAKAIVSGLSLALKATALGLCVAIPTLILYNIFSRKVDTLMHKFELANAENLNGGEGVRKTSADDVWAMPQDSEDGKDLEAREDKSFNDNETSFKF